MWLSRHRHRDAVLITDARPSQDRELAYRRRRYTVTMCIRAACLILAATFYRVPWLAISVAALAVVLPWIAVIMANDRMPPKESDAHRYTAEPDRELPPASDKPRVIDL